MMFIRKKADDPSISAFYQPLAASSEKIDTLNKPYQQQGMEKVMYPEEVLFNKQKNLLDLYKPKEIQAENVKKVGPGRPRKGLIRLNPMPTKKKAKDPVNSTS